LAHEVHFSRRPVIVLDRQHSACKWPLETVLKVADDVHEYTKAYFESACGVSRRPAAILSAEGSAPRTIAYPLPAASALWQNARTKNSGSGVQCVR
jgi:hypothetical protein